MIYIWLALIILSTSIFDANAYYKRVSGADLNPGKEIIEINENRKYIDRIRPKIDSHWHPRETKRPMRSIFFVTVQPSGHITNLELQRSSGNKYYDKTCKRALMAASPLKKPDEAKRIGIQFESHKSDGDNPISTVKDVALKPFKEIF